MKTLNQMGVPHFKKAMNILKDEVKRGWKYLVVTLILLIAYGVSSYCNYPNVVRIVICLIILGTIKTALKLSTAYLNKSAKDIMLDYAFSLPLTSFLAPLVIASLFGLDGDASYLAYVISFIVIVGTAHPFILWKYYVKDNKGNIKDLIHITDKAKEVILATAVFLIVVANLPLVTKMVGEVFPIEDNGFKKLTIPIVMAYGILRYGIEFVMRKRYEKDGSRYKIEEDKPTTETVDELNQILIEINRLLGSEQSENWRKEEIIHRIQKLKSKNTLDDVRHLWKEF
ncbi:hypothetical protein ACFVS2_20320 [Brevibacillus sp. NPDC058079]|uniref:hypothetical protein n=1 Tax=Brevibacillus sp. NPDC058079 TaxID=3346330 RepID=UPI0036F01EB7